MLVVLPFLGCIDAHCDREARELAVTAVSNDGQFTRAGREAFERKDLGAGQAQRFSVLTILVGQRQHAHADQVRTVNTLERFRYHRAYAEQIRALGRPVP